MKISHKRSSSSALRKANGQFTSISDEKKIRAIYEDEKFSKYNIQSVVNMYFENIIEDEPQDGRMLKTFNDDLEFYAVENPDLKVKFKDVGNATYINTTYSKVKERIDDAIKEIFRIKRSFYKDKHIPSPDLPIIDIKVRRDVRTEFPLSITFDLNAIYSENTPINQYIKELFR